jgi:DNA-binding transcriptional LysR family regulator
MGGSDSGKSAQQKATQLLSRIDRCFGIRTRRSDGQIKVPTIEAEQLAELCRDFFNKLGDFKARTEKSPDAFEVGAGDTLTFFILIPALRSAGAWRQSVQLHLQNLKSSQIVSGLLSGTLDVGLVRMNAVDELVRKKRLQAQKFCRLDYTFCVHADLLAAYPGKREDEAALVKWCLKEIPLATFWAESSTFTAALAKTGVDLPVQLCCQSFPQVLEAIVSGGYCGIIPRIALNNVRHAGLVAFGDKMLAETSRDVGLVWSSALTSRRKGGESALGVLRKAIKDSMKPVVAK